VFGPGSTVDAPVCGHERVPAHLTEFEVPLLADWVTNDGVRREEWQEVVITPPTVLVGDAATIDLGDRAVELLHLGRGHTDNDIVLHVIGSQVWLAGDLVEESGPPCYGSGSFPLDWPGTIARFLDLVGSDGVVVPGHGAVVDAEFTAAQQIQLQQVADLIRELHAVGVPVEAALAEGGDRWPFPGQGLAGAVRDGYRAL
jgi:glyoxylase-like metal-dependent hydrolase (beta-lactamase superfamily II)